MTDVNPYPIPEERGRWRALALAALVHLALLAFLWIGIRWQNRTPETVEAEVWNLKAQEAAPVPQATPVPPTPQPKEPPAPPPPAPTPVPKVVTPPVEDPEIKIAREKKKREEQARALQAEQQRKQEIAKKEAAKKEAERAQAEKERQKALQKQQEKKLAEAKAAEEKRKEEQRKKQLAEEKRKQAEAEQKALDERRKQDLDRLRTQAAGTGGTGTAARSQGIRGDASYASRVGAKIKSNTVFNVPDNLSDNSAVEYSVDLLPDGSVRSITKRKSSGIPGFDDAVARAIEKSQPYPPDRSGAVPSGFTVIHRPKDIKP